MSTENKIEINGRINLFITISAFLVFCLVVSSSFIERQNITKETEKAFVQQYEKITETDNAK